MRDLHAQLMEFVNYKVRNVDLWSKLENVKTSHTTQALYKEYKDGNKWTSLEHSWPAAGR